MEIQKVEIREVIVNEMEKGNMEEMEQLRMSLEKEVTKIPPQEMGHNLKEETEQEIGFLDNIVEEEVGMDIMVEVEEIGEQRVKMVEEVGAQIIVRIIMEFYAKKVF